MADYNLPKQLLKLAETFTFVGVLLKLAEKFWNRNKPVSSELFTGSKTDQHGNRHWRVNGMIHRENGPAIEYADGDKEWWIGGKLHRETGPAVELANGYTAWYLHGVLHRDSGPAIEWPLVYNRAAISKAWYANGKKHRIDGPAVEHANGRLSWWFDGKEYNDAATFCDAANITGTAKTIFLLKWQP